MIAEKNERHLEGWRKGVSSTCGCDQASSSAVRHGAADGGLHSIGDFLLKPETRIEPRLPRRV